MKNILNLATGIKLPDDREKIIYWLEEIQSACIKIVKLDNKCHAMNTNQLSHLDQIMNNAGDILYTLNKKP